MFVITCVYSCTPTHTYTYVCVCAEVARRVIILRAREPILCSSHGTARSSLLCLCVHKCVYLRVALCARICVCMYVCGSLYLYVFTYMCGSSHGAARSRSYAFFTLAHSRSHSLSLGRCSPSLPPSLFLPLALCLVLSLVIFLALACLIRARKKFVT